MNFISEIIAWFNRPNKSVVADYTESIIFIVLVAFIIRTFGFGLYQVPTCSMETTMLVGERFFADKFTVLFRNPQRGDIISFNDPNFNYSKNTLVRLWQEYVWGPSNWTKRVIGMPGDHVKGEIENGVPVVYLKKKGESEFKKLDEPYLNKYPIALVYSHDPSDPYVRRSFDPNIPLGEQQLFYNFTQADMRIGARVARLKGEESVLYPGTPVSPVLYGRYIDIFDEQLGDDEYWAMGDNRLGSYDSRGWGRLKKQFIHGKITFRILSMDTNQSWILLDLLLHPIKFFKQIRWNRCLQFVK